MAYEHVLVSLVILKADDRVMVTLHVVHPDVPRLLLGRGGTLLAPLRSVHRSILAQLRPLLHSLDVLRLVQVELERRNEAVTRAHGIALKRVLSPVVLHDACTLYAGLMAGMMAPWTPESAWFKRGRACAGCGHDDWGFTCTPPRLQRRRLVRDALAECAPFCWTCLRR